MFEKFGGDPLKRSVQNQLASQIIMAGVLGNTFYFPILTFRTLYGPLNYYIAIIGIVDFFCKNWKEGCRLLKVNRFDKSLRKVIESTQKLKESE